MDGETGQVLFGLLQRIQSSLHVRLALIIRHHSGSGFAGATR